DNRLCELVLVWLTRLMWTYPSARESLRSGSEVFGYRHRRVLRDLLQPLLNAVVFDLLNYLLLYLLILRRRLNRAALFQLDDVITERSFHQVADLAWFQRKRGIFKLGDHAPFREEIIFTAAALRSRIVRVLLGELCEVLAVADSIQQVQRFLLSLFVGQLFRLGVVFRLLSFLFVIGSLRSSTDKNMTHPDLVEIGGVLIEVLLHLCVVHLIQGLLKIVDVDAVQRLASIQH